MKFQNSSIHGFKVMLCIKKRDERTDGRTNNPEAICPFNFFEVGGITKGHKSIKMTRNPRKAMSHLRGLSHTSTYLY